MTPRHRWGWGIGIGLVAAIGLWALGPSSSPEKIPPAVSDLDPVRIGPPIGAPPWSVPPPEPSDPPVVGEDLRAAAQTLVGDNGVVCRVEPAVTGGTARLELDDPAEPWLAVAAIRQDVLVLSDVPADGSGTLVIEGFAPVALGWTGARGGDGRCTPDPLILSPAEAAVVGRIHGGLGAAVGVTVCGQSAVIDDVGGFFASAVPDRRCGIEVRRHYGVWEYVDALEVVPVRGEDVVARLSTPDFDAVLPIVWSDGRIEAVWDDLGDGLVGASEVRIDGQAVPQDADGFHLATGGAVGVASVVEGLVQGQARSAVIERRALTFEDWLVR